MPEDLPMEIEVESAAALKGIGVGQERVRWIDCREADEWQICHIEGAELVPLSQFSEQAPLKLADKAQRILVYCHHGVRSMRATQWLRAHGYHQAQSLRGGIDQWADLLDPQMKRY